MKRTYNNKISVKANMNISRREARVHFQRMLIVIGVILLLSIAILLGTSMKAFASSRTTDVPVYKYYTSIQIQPGDTLWDIAQEYTVNTDISVPDYIEEVRTLNHLSDTNVHSGEHIVVSYYSTEKK